MTENDIRNAYCKIRSIDNTIPDEVLDFMKNAAIEKLKTEVHENANILIDVNNCTHENTSFMHIRCNVCDDCGDVIEIDV
jgi:hypothetical protein